MKVVRNSIVKPTIYCYTTPNDKEHEGWCKIGYTDRDTAEHCVYKQTRRSDTPAKIIDWKLTSGNHMEVIEFRSCKE